MIRVPGLLLQVLQGVIDFKLMGLLLCWADYFLVSRWEKHVSVSIRSQPSAKFEPPRVSWRLFYL
ncbi:hypothetical protein ECE128010_4759 [Escherichia coli E128010]|nr:hypothetical protein ECE128010_4759 [Escherichia coli E128010]